MKKILVLILSLVCLIACNTGKGGKTYSLKENIPSKEYIEFMSQYHIIDSSEFKLESINAKIFQTLDEYEGLAYLCSNKQYGWYNGIIIYVISDDILYDDKIIKGNFYFVGTYKYTRRDSLKATVPLYMSKKVYDLEGKNTINNIREFNEKYIN